MYSSIFSLLDNLKIAITKIIIKTIGIEVTIEKLLFIRKVYKIINPIDLIKTFILNTLIIENEWIIKL